MPAIKISVEQFVAYSLQYPLIDVRSPGEYAHAHIPGAHSLPLFDDAERKLVGTTYKQIGRQDAIKIGLDYFGPKMRSMVEFVEQRTKAGRPAHTPAYTRTQNDHQHTEQENTKKFTVLVHCWRGGMRSGAVSWLLDLYGFEVYVLEGGYKAFRNWTLAQFQKDYPFKLIGGYTGSGKTGVLQELLRRGHSILDLEGIARHKGSAFGGLDKLPQPSTEMFENSLAYQLFQHTKNKPGTALWVEDESQRIGDVNLPMDLWHCFRTKPLFFLNVPFEERLKNIAVEYGRYKKEALINAIVRIQKRLGPLETKTAVNSLLENDIVGCFSILLKYYDKQYSKALHNRPNLEAVINKISTEGVDASINTAKILETDHERSQN